MPPPTVQPKRVSRPVTPAKTGTPAVVKDARPISVLIVPYAAPPVTYARTLGANSTPARPRNVPNHSRRWSSDAEAPTPPGGTNVRPGEHAMPVHRKFALPR